VYEKENSNLTRFTYNNTLTRYDILESLELRLGAEYLLVLRKRTNYFKVVLRRRQEQGMRALSARRLIILTGYNSGVEWEGFATTANGVYSVVLGYSIKDHIGVFGESYGNFPEENNKADIRFDTGITYFVLDNIQFDLSGGIGLNEAAPNIFIGAGFSGRFPN